MAGPTLRVRKLRPGVQRGPTPSHARCAPCSRRLGMPADPSPRPLTSQSRLRLPCGGAWSSPGPSHWGLCLPFFNGWGVSRKECPLRTGPALPYPWPLLGPWPGGCREALPCRDRQENAELSLVRREEGLVCEAACSGDRTQHTPCQPERRGEEAREQGRDRKENAPQLWELSPPRPHAVQRLGLPGPQAEPSPCSRSLRSGVSMCPIPQGPAMASWALPEALLQQARQAHGVEGPQPSRLPVQGLGRAPALQGLCEMRENVSPGSRPPAPAARRPLCLRFPA